MTPSEVAPHESTERDEPALTYDPYEAHPAADEFPLMAGADFDKFVADIEAHGQHQPVMLCPDGKRIADGRNRFRACQRLGIEPAFDTLGPEFDTDEKITDYIKSANLQRLHLDATQRAMIAARLATRYAEEGKERSRGNLRRGRSEGTSSEAVPVPPRRLVRPSRDRNQDAAERAAQEMEVSPRYVRTAQRVQAEAPDLAEEVAAGRLKLTAADKQRRLRHGPSKTTPRRLKPRASGPTPEPEANEHVEPATRDEPRGDSPEGILAFVATIKDTADKVKAPVVGKVFTDQQVSQLNEATKLAITGLGKMVRDIGTVHRGPRA